MQTKPVCVSASYLLKFVVGFEVVNWGNEMCPHTIDPLSSASDLSDRM